MIETILPLLGMALCAIAMLQLVLWSTQSLWQWSHNQKQFEMSREVFRQQINAARVAQADFSEQAGRWNGFREFHVDRLQRETELTMSVYLKPVDGKPIADFRAGQHLTVKFEIPGQSKPVVRCYSLSVGPGNDCYRISVKQMLPNGDDPHAPPGCASTFVNHSLAVGDRLQVKAPSGHFLLDESTDMPVVMLAGGIGITPMISMIDRLVQTNSNRTVILVYGSRNGSDHAFKDYLGGVANQRPNIKIFNIYSQPLNHETEGVDFHKQGFITNKLLQQLLPSIQYQVYLCGPPRFMELMHQYLMDRQIPDSKIFFEAFGPASIGKKNSVRKKDDATPVSATPVNFSRSQKSVDFNGSYESILELAEDNDAMIDSGCRAGSCGTCETALLRGKVCYPEGTSVDCPPGSCLACIAKPDGPIELDA